MEVIITGSSGQLGHELLHTAPDNWNITNFSHSELDICDPERIHQCFIKTKPDLVINTAAYTAVDRAEQEPDLAYAINATGVGNLANAAIEYNVRLIQLSTDFVFNSQAHTPYQPNDETNPVNVYGRSKLEGEQKLTTICDSKGLILRTSWLYSAYGHNFVKTMLNLMQKNKTIKVVSDQIGCPTWAKGMAETIWHFAEKPDISGIYHWSDSGSASWYDFACAIYEEALLLELLKNPVEIIPIITEMYPTAAKRPAYSVLDTTATCELMDSKPIHWRTALKSMLLELKDLT